MSLGLGLYLSRRLKTLKRYLLNVFTGAAAAYSLRKLEKDATYAVRVRRSTDNSELDIGFDKDDQLDTTALLDFVNVRNEYPADYDTGAAAAYSLRYVTERPDTKPADFGSGAAAAYSLRYVSSTYSGAVVRVRRSSDNAEADFTATEVSDGTLEAWVNTDVVVRSLDATSGNEDLNEENGIGTDGETIAGVSDAYKLTLSGGSAFHSARYISILDTTQTYRVTFDYYIPSSNIAVDGIYYFFSVGSNELFNTLDQWVTVTKEGACTGSHFWIRATGGGLETVNADGDVFYLKNIVITQTTSNGLVTTWYDQSTNNNHATQGSASRQPKIVDAGTLVTENGKPAMDFDGSNDGLLLNISLSGAFSFFHVQTLQNFQAAAYRSFYGAASAFRYTSGHYPDSGQKWFFNNGVLLNTGVLIDYNQNLHFDLFNGASSAKYLNGGLLATGNAGTSTATNLYIGRDFFGDYINTRTQEFLIYPSDQSSNRKNIEWDINDYYGIYSQWDRESVVRVRRSVDNAEADFNPTEITDGTMLDWVNADVVKYTSDFTSGNEDLVETNGVGTDGETIAGVSDAYKFTLTGGNVGHQASRAFSFSSDFSYTISLDYYIPSSNSKVTSIGITPALQTFGGVDEWKSITTNEFSVTDPFLRIRAGNPFYPSIDADGDVFYLKNIVVTQLTSDGYVTTWYDQSGNSNDATQGTAASQPKIVDAGVLVEENGKPALDFDGVDDGMEMNTTFNLSTVSTSFVFSADTGQDSVLFQIFQNLINFLSFGIGNSGTEDAYGTRYRVAGSDYTIGQSGVSGQKLAFHIGEQSTPNIDLYLNSATAIGTQISRASNTIASTLGYRSDGGLPSNSKIQELILFDTDQSSNRGNIEANVNDYYSIYTSTNDGFVTTWYDQAGSNDATQATAARQPQIVDGGSLITENGKVAVQFDGSDDFMDFTPTQSATKSVFFAGNITANTSSRARIFEELRYNGASNNAGYIIQQDGSDANNPLQIQIYNDGLTNISYNNPTMGGVLIEAIITAGSQELYLNSNQVATGTATMKSDFNNGKLSFSTSPTDGKYQEILVYNSDQSGNRTAIEGNINKNYQVYWDGAGYSLLDNFAGAEAAYALVPLSSTYRGAIVKVRRSSDNAERDIYANYDGTLDTASLLDFCSGTDGYVSVWYDQSGNGNNAVQSTASSQPKIVSGGSLITSNGYTVIQYDGSDDNLTTSLTATGTMLMGGSDGSAFYEVAISGSYNLLRNASLTDHPLNESIRVIWGSSLTTAQKTAIETAVTYTDWDFSDVTDFYRYWRDRSELTDFPIIDTSSGTNFKNAWFSCSSLTSFPALDLSSGTDFEEAWRGCSSLTSFPLLDVSSGTIFNFAWRLCSSITSFPALDVSSGTFFISTWNGCSSLQDFPANMFDSVTGTNFTGAFTNTNLTQTSIDNILTSIDTANTSNGTFNQSGGSAPSAVGEAAIDNLRARGWTVTVTGGY